MREKKKLKLTASLVATMLLFLTVSASTFENPGLQVIIDYWSARGIHPDTVRMMSTLPSLVSLPFMILTGAFVGKKISFRTASITGALLVTIGGLAPFVFAPTWGVVLVFRAIMGVGIGFGTCRNALLLSSVPADQQAGALGIAQTIGGIIGLIYGPIIAGLAMISWRHIFLINLISVITLIGTFFIKDPVKISDAVQTADQTDKKKVPVSKKAVMLAVLQMVVTGVDYAFLLGVSTYIDTHGIGTVAIAGTAMIAYTLGALAVSSIGVLQKIFKRFTMLICYFIIAAGFAALIFAPGLITCFISMFLIAYGFTCAYTLLQVNLGQSVSPEQLPFSTSLLLIGNQIGLFIATFIIAFAQAIFRQSSDVDSVIILAVIVYAVIGL